jgi:hypothetical protein
VSQLDKIHSHTKVQTESFLKPNNSNRPNKKQAELYRGLAVRLE